MVPGYPVVPIFAFLSSTLLLLVLITSAVRRSWNFGLTVLCVCVFVENFCGAIETVVWKDNADIKLYAFCDFISRWQILTSIVKPACTLVITRKLHQIACMQSPLQTDKQRRCDIWLNVTLLIILPVLVAGPLYYIVQTYRFVIIEGYGCTSGVDASFASIVLVHSWRAIFPLISIAVYCPRIFWTFYKHNQTVNRFLTTNGEVSRSRFLRVLFIGSLDILITLPQGLIAIIDMTLNTLDSHKTFDTPLFYLGWEIVHRNWSPIGVSYAEFGEGRVQKFTVEYGQWTSIVLACVIFALFGVNGTAREGYWKAIRVIGGACGWHLKDATKKRAVLLPISFKARTQASDFRMRFSVFVDVASAVRRDARGSIEAEHLAPHPDYTQHSVESAAVSTLPSYRASFDSDKSTAAPSYDGPLDSHGTNEPLPPMYRSDIEMPPSAFIPPRRQRQLPSLPGP
ncbi:unnamed protein product [Peniophora sp. CBMAI 1063]|nr:unnamed protein product [Peniophora sp. CBMAI 1063]